jgi:hypothetical protein
MIVRKKVDLGEYIIDIEYDDVTGAIEVTVLDELEGVIESITITNTQDSSDDDDNDVDVDFNDFNINLN